VKNFGDSKRDKNSESSAGGVASKGMLNIATNFEKSPSKYEMNIILK